MYVNCSPGIWRLATSLKTPNNVLPAEMTSKTVSDLRIKLLKKGFFDCRHHGIQMGLKELKLFSQEYPKGNKERIA